MNNKELLRKLPKVDELLKETIVLDNLNSIMRPVIIETLRETIDGYRKKILDGDIIEFEKDKLLEDYEKALKDKNSPKLKKVINCTGVVLHTNLGRALLSENAISNILNCANCYSNLEYNLETGARGSRYSHMEELITRITGAEAAMVVNNNAAAVMLVLNTLCRDKEAIVSRGQLVEIGGSFRIPEVMGFSGAKLVEIGTTNRTHICDYENAVNENTGVFLKVHTSNFKIIGFTEEVSLEQLVSLGEKYNIPTIEDIGSGVFIDFSKYGLSYEPTVQESVKKGVDIITFSGDKMLGGPQAGIIIGKKKYIDLMKKNQLTRALRIDKLTLSALEGTLKYYLDEEFAINNIPTLKMLLTSKEVQKVRAQKLKNKIQQNSNLKITIESSFSMVGGGSMPSEKIPTYTLKITSNVFSADYMEKILRANDTPIIVRIADNSIILDLRTIFDKDFHIISKALNELT